MNKISQNFKDTQYALAAHIRDPENNPAPTGIEDRRLGIYRDLFYKNVESFISGGFPVLRKLYNGEQWHQLVRAFFSQHQSSSPYFLEISQEFLGYLQKEHQMRSCDPPFLLELAHYEWVELALLVLDETIDMTGIDANADMLNGHPILSPLAWSLAYQWPVHQLGPDYQPQEPPSQPTYVIVFRDRNDKVRFVIINAITAKLLFLLQDNSQLSGQSALEKICEELQHPNPEVVIKGGLETLEQLKGQGIILGTSPVV